VSGIQRQLNSKNNSKLLTDVREATGANATHADTHEESVLLIALHIK
jgi:hypothetical protein